jgi:hypothetical protein
VDDGTEGKESNKGEIIDELLEPSDTPSDTKDVGLAGSFPAAKRESKFRGCIASSGRRAVRREEGGGLCGV